MYEVFDFDNYDAKFLESELNKRTKDGSTVEFINIEKTRGMVNGIILLKKPTKQKTVFSGTRGPRTTDDPYKL